MMNKIVEAIKSLINITLTAPFDQVSQMGDLVDGLAEDIETISSIIPREGAPASGAYVAPSATTEPAASEVVPSTLYPSNAEGKVEPLPTTATTKSKEDILLDVISSPTTKPKHKYHKTEALLVINVVGGLGLKWYPVDSVIPKVKKKYPDIDSKIIRRVLRQQTFAKLSEPVWQYSEAGDKILKRDRGVIK